MKKTKLLLTVACASVLFSMTSFAGEWKQDNTGWYYLNDDGSYPASAWQEIDGKQYYFNERGYSLTNTTTPDGKKVDSSGALITPVFDFQADDSRITYTGWRTATDYDGYACVILYYDFTNKDAESQSSQFSDSYITVFQNGVECDRTFLSYDEQDEALKNYSKKVTQGTTTKVAQAFRIKGMSPLTIEIKELWKWSNPNIQTTALNIY
jgi:hypothetical protein